MHMFKKKDPGLEANYSNIPSGLGAGKALKECRALDDAFDRQVASREKANAVHNAAASKGRKQAGIKGQACNRGLARPITGASKFNEGK
jgi:hypothetical protein